MQYKRILLKLSGEALKGEEEYNEHIINSDITFRLAQEIKEIHHAGVEIGIVVGGGNIFRGKLGVTLGMDRVKGDHMGMIATVINALALESAFMNVGLDALVQSAIPAGQAVQDFYLPGAIKDLEEGRIVIFAGGTGNPYFTTDTGAALRAVQTKCNVFLKATKVKGVYDKDPHVYDDAKFFETLSFQEASERNLQVLDQTAFSLCRENNMPIFVFNLFEEGNLQKAVKGENVGTLVS